MRANSTDNQSPRQREVILPSGKLVLAYVPSGVSVVGTSDEEYASIAQMDPRVKPDMMRRGMPQHIVLLDSFWIGVNMVTVAQYADFCKAVERELPPMPSWGSFSPEHPITNVSWHEAVEFCGWLSKTDQAASYRLPTEAEREKASRGIDGRFFPWGDEWMAAAVWSDYDNPAFNSVPAAVGSHPRDSGPYGCFDVLGNGFEWCLDFYDEDYYRVSPPTNPRGPEHGYRKALRSCGAGLGFREDTPGYNFLAGFRCASRGGADPQRRMENVGFRVVAEA